MPRKEFVPAWPAAPLERPAGHGVSAAQLPVAWAIAKGTLPIIGVTKADQVEDAVQAACLELSQDEIRAMETMGDQAGLNVIRYWEKEMK